MRIVLDTNVVVSGLLHDASIPTQVLDVCIAGAIDLLVDRRILAEYRDVLCRREFGLDQRDVDEFLSVAAYAEHVVGLPLPFSLPDPSDLPFLECAVAGAADALVTGNTRHFRLTEGRLEVPILTPRQFMQQLSGR